MSSEDDDDAALTLDGDERDFDGDVDDEEEGEEEETETVSGDRRAATLGLDSMPGWSPTVMGAGITGVPATFQVGLPGYWAPWSADAPFLPGHEPVPVRILCLNIPASFWGPDCSRVGEFETSSDPIIRARQVSAAALLGLLTTGTAKGYVATDEHSELAALKASDADADEISKAKTKLHGNVTTYTYQPYARHADARRRDLTAPQCGFFLEELYSADKSRVVAVRFFKAIYCASHSDDELWKHLIAETSEITRAGSINAIPEGLRKPRLMAQNKLQRSQINDEELETTTSTQWKRITSLSDLVKHMKNHAGASDGCAGRPFYSDISRDTATGSADRPLKGDKHWGGKHPLGPSVALNFKRHVSPNVVHAGHPGVNVALAGTVDANGSPLDILSCQTDPGQYFLADGTFRPPAEVLEMGAFHCCHDGSVKNVFCVPFPRPLHGAVVPDDVLLKAFFELRKGDMKVLAKTQERGPKAFEDVPKDVVLSAFTTMATERDAEAAAISRSILASDMLSQDSLDKTVAEQERLDRRAYEKTSVGKKGDVWVLEPRQVLKDISLEQERTHAMVDEWNDVEFNKIEALTSKSREERTDLHSARRARHTKIVEACVRFGLRRFEHAFTSKKLSATIPPGWHDVCHVGLRAAMAEAGKIGMRLSDSGGRKVDPNDPNSKAGTANVAFAHAQGLTSADLSPWGHYRLFLTHMLSSGLKIKGDQIRLMLDLWIHCFEPCASALEPPQPHRLEPRVAVRRFQEVSFFYLM